MGALFLSGSHGFNGICVRELPVKALWGRVQGEGQATLPPPGGTSRFLSQVL